VDHKEPTPDANKESWGVNISEDGIKKISYGKHREKAEEWRKKRKHVRSQNNGKKEWSIGGRAWETSSRSEK